MKNLRDNQNFLSNYKLQIKKGNISAISFRDSVGAGSDSPNSGFEIADSDQSRFNEITNLEKQLSDARTKYKVSSIMVTSLLEKYKFLKPELIDIQINSVDKALEINQIYINRATDSIEKQKNDFKFKPEIIKEFYRITQNLEIAEDNVIQLLKARENFQLQIAQQSSPWQILSIAEVDEKPFFPNIIRFIVLIFFFSTLISFLIIYIRDLADTLFHTPDEIKKHLNDVILGNIPYINALEDTRNKDNSINEILSEMDKFDTDENLNEEDLKNKRYEKFIYQESFRNLYTSIRFSNIDKKFKKLMITSSVPKEGKSLINIVLAKTLSDIGLKVLLIDADMRKPQIHKRFGLNNILGLSNIILENKNDLKNIVQKIPDFPGLDILTSGRIVPDTTRLLRSDRMKDFIKEIDKEHYDYIIFDPPPILGLSDANLISEYCDGTFLIVSIENVDKNLPLNSIAQLKKTSNFLGIITNGSKKSEKKTDYYNNGYTNYLYKSYSNEENDSDETEKGKLKSILAKLKHLWDLLDK